MATEALRQTPEATISAAVTGHLGPVANADVDGIVFVSIAQRANNKIETVTTARIALTTRTREERQVEVAEKLLETIEKVLNSKT